MVITGGCTRLGSSTETTTTQPIVNCPECDVNTQIADVIGGSNFCVSCEALLGDTVDTREETLPGFTCGTCGTTTAPMYETTGSVGNIELLNCSGDNCNRTVAANYSKTTFQPYSELLTASWVRSTNSSPTGVNITPVETAREQAAVQILNLEAKEEDRSFRLYNPDSANALLVEYHGDVTGYLTWNVGEHPDDGSNPAILRQIFILPQFRRQKLATHLVETFLETVVSDRAGGEYTVEGANASTLQLLKSMGEVSYDVTNDAVENIDTKRVSFTKTNPFAKLRSALQ